MSDLDPETGLKVRAMAAGDLERVMEIAASLATAPHWTRAAYESVTGDGPRRIALVAEDGGEVLGFAIAGVVAQEAEIETIAVDEPAQGYGIGSMLLRTMFEQLRPAGVSEVALEVRASNEGAFSFYERAGFRAVGRRRGYYREPVEDAVLLRLKL